MLKKALEFLGLFKKGKKLRISIDSDKDGANALYCEIDLGEILDELNNRSGQ
jgi:hypothetical protein